MKKRKYKSPRKGSHEYWLIQWYKKLDAVSIERLTLENQYYIMMALSLILEGEEADPEVLKNCYDYLWASRALTINLIHRRFKGFTHEEK